MTDHDILDYRVRAMEDAMVEIRDSQRSIADSLAKLVVLEQQHHATADALGRAFTELKDVRHRVDKLEDLPTTVKHLAEVLGEIKRFVYGGAAVVLLAVGGLALDAVLSGQHYQEAAK